LEGYSSKLLFLKVLFLFPYFPFYVLYLTQGRTVTLYIGQGLNELHKIQAQQSNISEQISFLNPNKTRYILFETEKKYAGRRVN
jgi:hypothetical protein